MRTYSNSKWRCTQGLIVLLNLVYLGLGAIGFFGLTLDGLMKRDGDKLILGLCVVALAHVIIWVSYVLSKTRGDLPWTHEYWEDCDRH